MAIFSWSAATETVGETPSAFTPVQNVSSALVQNDGAENYMSFQRTSGDAIAAFVPPGASISDCEVWMRTVPSGNSNIILRLRNQGGSSILVQASARVMESPGFNQVAASTQSVDGVSIYQYRIQVIGADVKNKKWNDGASEPGWITENIGALSSLGASSVEVFSNQSELRVYELEVRTGSDMAGYTEPEPSMTVNQANLTPGGSISGTYNTFAQAPTTLEGIRGANTITSAGATPQITGLTINNTVAGDGTNEGTFTATIAALPTTGTAQFLRLSDTGIADPTWRLS